MMNQKIAISQEAVEFFTSIDFFAIVLKNSYNVRDYAKALAHLSWGNKALSLRLINQTMAIYDCGKRQYDYLTFLKHFLKIDDRDVETGEPLKP